MKSKIVSGLLVLALSAGILLTGFAGTALAAEKTPPAIDDTYTIDGVTYYNVNSANFDSSKKFYEDVFNAKHSSLGGRSLAELWMLAAVGMGKSGFLTPIPPIPNIYHPISPISLDELLDDAKKSAQKGYGYGNLQNYSGSYRFTAPKWNNSGYVETSLQIWIGRSEYCSPEVDPEVLISDQEDLNVGQFYEVRITDSEAFDLYAETIH